MKENFWRAVEELRKFELDTELRMTGLEPYIGRGIDEVASFNYQTLVRAAQLIADEYGEDVATILDWVFEEHGHLEGYEEARQ